NQRFYVLADTPETYYLDVVVFSDLNEEAYREYFNESRHGRPVVLFDKSQLLQQASQSPKTITFSLDIKNEQAKFEILYRTFLKEALREKYIDAHTFYYRLIFIYVKILRSIHSPQK